MLKGIDNLQTINYNVYNRIHNDPKDAALNKAGQGSELKVEEKREPKENIELRLDDIKPRQNASLEDISLSLNEPKGFEMKGRDSDINSLDMEKAVSDMQKDQALMQYQYFVGDTNIFNSEDGVVIAK